MMRKAPIAAFSLLLSIALNAPAQETKPCGCACPGDAAWIDARPVQVPDAGRVSGSVVFESGPLPGATVVLEKSNVRYTQVSDANGHFEFFNVLPGVYRITAELQGLRPATIKPVDVPAGVVATVAFRLRADESQMICVDCGDALPLLPDEPTFVITRQMMDTLPIP